jgi:hypothetical protein
MGQAKPSPRRTRRHASTSKPSSAAADGFSSAAARVATAPLRGGLAALAMGIVVERNARSALRSASRRATRGAFDATLDRLLAEDTIEFVMKRLAAEEVPERVADRMLEDGIAERIASRVIEGPELERILVAAMSSDQMQGALTRAMTNEAVVEWLERFTKSEGTERLVALLIDSPIPDEIARQLLETEALWVFVDEIARSPSVTEAITHQGAGFVDEIADKARDRSRMADAWVQRVARRVGRRRNGAGGSSAPPAPLADAEAP